MPEKTLINEFVARSVRFAWLLLAVLAGAAGATEQPGRYVELPDVRLWIVDSGGAGEGVILLHPRTGNADYWQYTVPALAAAGFRALAIDSPGWGRSIVRDGAEPEPVAKTIDALLDELGLQSVHVVGTAMGGYVALDFAATYPGRTRTLVIAASGLGLEGDPEYTGFRQRADIPAMREQPSYLREISATYRGTNPEGVARWMAIYENSEQEGAVRPPLASPNTPAKLASLEMPVLVIAGGADLVTPSHGVRLWSRHIRAPKEFIVLPEAGHVLVWEQPDVFNELLLDFLAAHRR
ncbi:MAG: alpha/beta hydrolase [Woeseiaceae bacterium]|nr:alpha/beta hydrolase [Woeseiaceae bacterium]